MAIRSEEVCALWEGPLKYGITAVSNFFHFFSRQSILTGYYFSLSPLAPLLLEHGHTKGFLSLRPPTPPSAVHASLHFSREGVQQFWVFFLRQQQLIRILFTYIRLLSRGENWVRQTICIVVHLPVTYHIIHTAVPSKHDTEKDNVFLVCVWTLFWKQPTPCLSDRKVFF